MEIKIQCWKNEEGKWHIDDPGPVFITERRVIWTFQGLEAGIVPLLAFNNNPPHGPFPDAWLTGSTFAGELDELPLGLTSYEYEILLIHWAPGQSQSRIVAKQPHKVSVEARAPVQIKVSWEGPGCDVLVDPPTCPVGGDCPVEWQFAIPKDVFATIDFATPDSGRALLPMGPFAELHGRRVDGVYTLTGQTDLVKDGYSYTVSLYDRKTGDLVTQEDPKIDNNGVPPGVGERDGDIRQEPGGGG